MKHVISSNVRSGRGIEVLEPRRMFADMFEPNNTLATANDFGSLGSRSESILDIDPTGDQDFYRFTAAGSGNIRIRIDLMSPFGT